MKILSRMLTRKPTPEETLGKIELDEDLEPLRRRDDGVADDFVHMAPVLLYHVSDVFEPGVDEFCEFFDRDGLAHPGVVAYVDDQHDDVGGLLVVEPG